MKKALSLLLAAAIALPLAACGGNNSDGGQAGNGQASNNQLANGVNTAKTASEWVISQAGVTIVPAESWKSEDVYMALSGQELDDGITMVNVAMYAASEAELEALSEQYSDDAEKLQEQYDAIGYGLFTIVGLRNDVGEDDFRTWLDNAGAGDLDFSLAKLGEAEGWSFYQMDRSDVSHPEPPEDKKALVEQILADTDAVIAGLKFFQPVPAPKTEAGSAITFETVDFDGNPVSSADLFSQNKVTMVNLWMSWCGPCIQELPELDKLNERFAEKGCAIVGVMLDGDDEAALTEGKDIVDATKASYTMLVPTAEMKEQFVAQAFPTTYFVDSNGVVLGEPIVGALVDDYESALDALLAQLD